ncbi:MAG: CNNM domain-containing protein [Planctomycetota bacterium]|nr:CNNM domain-containing protein [Planctomycetota bacterium]
MIASVYIVQAAGWAMLLTGMVLSFLYSGMETGCYAVNKIRLDLRSASGNRSARRLLDIHRHLGRAIVVLLVGNNFANYLASAGMVVILTHRGWLHAEWYSVAILTPVIFIFCELLPKNLFHRHAETLTYAFSIFLDFSRRVFSALGLAGMIHGMMWMVMKLAGQRWGEDSKSQSSRFGASSQEEMPFFHSRHVTGILAEGRAGGALTHTQSAIAERIVNISRVKMPDVMVPLDEAVLVEESASIEQVRELLRRHGHPRFGVYSGGRDNIVGVLNAYDVLLDNGPEASPAAHITEPLTLGEHLSVIEALVRMQQRREVMGLVVSQTGKYVGLVTVKDLVEEIVGELEEW